MPFCPALPCTNVYIYIVVGFAGESFDTRRSGCRRREPGGTAKRPDRETPIYRSIGEIDRERAARRRRESEFSHGPLLPAFDSGAKSASATVSEIINIIHRSPFSESAVSVSMHMYMYIYLYICVYNIAATPWVESISLGASGEFPYFRAMPSSYIPDYRRVVAMSRRIRVPISGTVRTRANTQHLQNHFWLFNFSEEARWKFRF